MEVLILFPSSWGCQWLTSFSWVSVGSVLGWGKLPHPRSHHLSRAPGWMNQGYEQYRDMKAKTFAPIQGQQLWRATPVSEFPGISWSFLSKWNAIQCFPLSSAGSFTQESIDLKNTPAHKSQNPLPREINDLCYLSKVKKLMRDHNGIYYRCGSIIPQLQNEEEETKWKNAHGCLGGTVG